MFAAVTPILTLLTATAIYVRADPNPNSPGPGDVFIQGQPCAISWDVDSTGLWKTMNIELMTGNNFNMVSLTPVATVDGTNPSKNTFSYTCPQVSPHSPIYFYQFTSPSTSNKTWTGRFTITDSANDVVAPSQSTQPDGEKIPWGTGSLASGSSSAAPPVPKASVPASSTDGTLVTLSHFFCAFDYPWIAFIVCSSLGHFHPERRLPHLFRSPRRLALVLQQE
ncbi:hypothetical protein J3R83DRAFT_8647 [Lanmaoa asiatica]|nr:hypothetical protein J3R83DRAFT_8647 [Lanmaoa asiatica]